MPRRKPNHRFVTHKVDIGTTRPEWWVRDTLTDHLIAGPYDRRYQAARMAIRWSAEPRLAETEAPRKET